ncbi:hypothetical protein PACTADRAFT_35285 [Pachysolen tannophilus NRRL Y-2460]|uniref:Uncharacterized protein n=1 Tax=Pachysolen tannophilus NRRL Y-2460 TaxID=669874 RepID=A0A1E4TRX1_PACTA|nr:hypothetical protein PACTADRAFT_35285 [Pachysolen tannophilus NRRL Y-2460]
MVKKLSFKGDQSSEKKKKKRSRRDSVSDLESSSLKKKAKTPDPNDIIVINNKLTDINTLEPSSLETGWTTANYIGDLSGPIIIIPESQKLDLENKPLCLSINGTTDQLEFSSNLQSLENTINFSNYEDDNLTKLEPLEKNQVFILTNVVNLIGTKQEKLDSKLNKSNSVKLSIKTFKNKYLTLKNGTNDEIAGDSNVLTNNEIFKFVKNEDKVSNKITWQIRSINDDKKLIFLKNNKLRLIKDEEDLLDDLSLFTIRIQIQNSVMSKKVRLLRKES